MENQYDFIVNASQGRSGVGAKPRIPGSKITLIAGGGILLIIIVIVVASLVSGGGGTRDALLRVVQNQNEIVRITNLNVTTAASQETRNIVLNTQVSIQSAQNQTISVVGTKGVGFKDQELKLLTDTEIETSLENAQAAGTLDSTIIATLADQMASYTAALQDAYDSSDNEEIRKLLNKLYQEAIVLTDELE